MDYTDHYGIKNPYLGAHEMVHVISQHILGTPGTKMMSEGYAVWIDGSYARHDIEQIIKHYRDHEEEKILSPDQLLKEVSTEESIYYPNTGLFLRFLANTYGVEMCNKLFTITHEKFVKKFEKLSGISWDEMNGHYNEYLKNL
jgi:hypothetical protein